MALPGLSSAARSVGRKKQKDSTGNKRKRVVATRPSEVEMEDGSGAGANLKLREKAGSGLLGNELKTQHRPEARKVGRPGKTLNRRMTLPSRRVRTSVTPSKPSRGTAAIPDQRREGLRSGVGLSLQPSKAAPSMTPEGIVPMNHSSKSDSSLSNAMKRPRTLSSYPSYAEGKGTQLPVVAGVTKGAPASHTLFRSDNKIAEDYALGFLPALHAPSLISEPAVSMLESYPDCKPVLRGSDSSQHINELIAKYSHAPLEQDSWSPRRSAGPAPWMGDPGPCQLSRCPDVLDFLNESSRGSRGVSVRLPPAGLDQGSYTGGRAPAGLGPAWVTFGQGPVLSSLPQGSVEAPALLSSGGKGAEPAGVVHAAGGEPGEGLIGGGGWEAREGGSQTEAAPPVAGAGASHGGYQQEGSNTQDWGRRLESLLDMAELDVGDAQVSDWLLDAPCGDDWVADDWMTEGDQVSDAAEVTVNGKSLVRVGTNESSTAGAHCSTSSPTEGHTENEVDQKVGGGGMVSMSLEEEVGEGIGGVEQAVGESAGPTKEFTFWKANEDEWLNVEGLEAGHEIMWGGTEELEFNFQD